MQQNDMNTVGKIEPDLDFRGALKDKLRLLLISDSPWAPTGFGTNTKNIACILYEDGHHIAYGGCQNPQHQKWTTPWPLGQTEKRAVIENLPLLFPGQERFGEKSFPEWVKRS